MYLYFESARKSVINRNTPTTDLKILYSLNIGTVIPKFTLSHIAKQS